MTESTLRVDHHAATTFERKPLLRPVVYEFEAAQVRREDRPKRCLAFGEIKQRAVMLVSGRVPHDPPSQGFELSSAKRMVSSKMRFRAVVSVSQCPPADASAPELMDTPGFLQIQKAQRGHVIDDRQLAIDDGRRPVDAAMQRKLVALKPPLQASRPDPNKVRGLGERVDSYSQQVV
jgi:hypothetical protein